MAAEGYLHNRELEGEAHERKVAAIFECAPTNWAAYVPDHPGCMTSGETQEERKPNRREAIEGHLETVREFGDAIPEVASIAGEVEIKGG